MDDTFSGQILNEAVKPDFRWVKFSCWCKYINAWLLLLLLYWLLLLLLLLVQLQARGPIYKISYD